MTESTSSILFALVFLISFTLILLLVPSTALLMTTTKEEERVVVTAGATSSSAAAGGGYRGSSSSSSSALSALDQARALTIPKPTLQYGGEFEHGEWWAEHEKVLEEARVEWGRRHPELYNLDSSFAERFFDANLLTAFQTKDRDLLKKLMKPTNVPSVYTFRLFTPEFTQVLLDELDHHEESGIPQRRPNGMNRYGTMLSELGFSSMVNTLAESYLVPIARELFPEFVGPDDLAERYAFTVRYRQGEDVSLAEHTDASTITVNICLEPSATDPKPLYFKERRTLEQKAAFEMKPNVNATYVEFSEPGHALIHLGQHVHGVSAVDSPRSQLVMWLFGEAGYVRVAPYEPREVKAHGRLYDSFWRKGKKNGKVKHQGDEL